MTASIVAWTRALTPAHAQVDPSTINTKLNAADADLNATYHELMGTLPPAERQQLLLAERAWVAFIEKNQTAFRAVAAKRNMPQTQLASATLAETQARRDTLRSMRNGSSNVNRDQLSRDLAQADSELNKAYKECSASLDKTDAALLLAAQRAWLAFRDAQGRTRNALPTSLMVITRRSSQLREFYLGAAPATEVANQETGRAPLEAQNSSRIIPDPFERAR